MNVYWIGNKQGVNEDNSPRRFPCDEPLKSLRIKTHSLCSARQHTPIIHVVRYQNFNLTKLVQVQLGVHMKTMKQIYKLSCLKCNKEYKIELTQYLFDKGKYKKHCSRKCANSRTWAEADKIKKSISAKNSEKVKAINNLLKKSILEIKCKNCSKRLNRKAKSGLCRKCFNKNIRKEFIIKGSRVCISAPEEYKGKLYDGKYILRYRYVMEQHIGRLLKDNEIVHHKDKDITNDSIENLELMTNQDHAAFHNKKGRFDKELKCSVCNKIFYIKLSKWKYKIKHKQQNFYCSRNCLHINLRLKDKK